MSTYILRDGQMVDKDTGAPMLTDAERARELQLPRVFGDEPGYESPIDGSWIDGRRARRYDLEKNNCVDTRELKPVTDGKMKNEAFARKRGLEHMLR